MLRPARIQWFGHAVRGAPPAPRFAPEDFDPPLRTRLLILQPTPFCNIDCDYCYLPDRRSNARMSLETVRLAAQRLRDDGLAGPELTVVWHAGEPLAMPVAFYEDAIAAVADVLSDTCAVRHAIQTNATLVDDAWCALFLRHGVQVGVSVDGPAALHDAHRRTRGGKGTHAAVLRGMRKLREHGIPFHAIAVVTAATFADAGAFHAFFVQEGVTELGCNFDEAEGPHGRSSLEGAEAAHARFLTELMRCCTQPGATLPVRELHGALRTIREGHPQYRWQGESWPDNAQAMPFALLSVAHDGRFSTFSPELLGQSSPRHGDFVLGNVHEGGYLASARTERFGALWGEVLQGVRACKERCAWFAYCGGGAPANKLYENGGMASGETLYCRTMVQRPLETVLSHIERGLHA